MRERDSHRAQSEPRGSEVNPRQLEELHVKLDKANIELKNMSEENEKLEIESRKYRNQLEHSKTLLDAAFENEAKCKSEAEATKRELVRLQDKLEQAEAELRHIRMERDKFASDYTHKHKSVESDLDKLHLEIAQLTTERDQLVRQLEKSQVKLSMCNILRVLSLVLIQLIIGINQLFSIHVKMFYLSHIIIKLLFLLWICCQLPRDFIILYILLL